MEENKLKIICTLSECIDNKMGHYRFTKNSIIAGNMVEFNINNLDELVTKLKEVKFNELKITKIID